MVPPAPCRGMFPGSGVGGVTPPGCIKGRRGSFMGKVCDFILLCHFRSNCNMEISQEIRILFLLKELLSMLQTLILGQISRDGLTSEIYFFKSSWAHNYSMYT